VAPGKKPGNVPAECCGVFDSGPCDPGSSRGVGRVLQGRQGKVVKPVAQARLAVAGRGSFPHPPWPSTVTGRAFEVFPGAAPTTGRSRWTEALVDLPPLQSARTRRGIGEPTPSSRGIRRMCPLVGVPFARPLPGAGAPFGPTGATRQVMFRPRGSSPPRRFPPRGGRGFVAPRSRTRVRRVSRSPAPVARGRPKTVAGAGRSQWRSPRRGSHPSKSSLRRQPHRIAAAVASMPLPSRRSGSTTQLDEAPIRRSGPPRHRAEGPGTGRSPRDTPSTEADGMQVRGSSRSGSASRPCSVDRVR
jgi:hypothetical protein